MKCPVLWQVYSIRPDQERRDLSDCLKEECGVWDGHGGFCSILKISRHLEAISKSLEDIAKELTLIRASAK